MGVHDRAGLAAPRPRVAFFSPLWARKGPLSFGASDYWRLAVPAIALYRDGWDVVFGRAIGPGEDGRLVVQGADGDWHHDRDVIVWHRWMGRDAAPLIRQARRAGQVMVNDLDDWLWGLPEDHPARRVMDPKLFPDYNTENYRAALEASSLITVSTPWLRHAAADFGPPVRAVRNYVDLDAWPEQPPGRHVGWVGSTDGRAEDLRVLRENVVPWCRDRGIAFYHGGAIPGEPLMKDVLGYDQVLSRAVQSIPNYPRVWDPLRVALIPLARDTDYGRAKSWVKALEACARGIPFIASEHPEYRELGAGLIAERPEDWARFLSALDDPAFYAEQASQNRARAEALAISQNWERWDEVLTQVKEENLVSTSSEV